MVETRNPEAGSGIDLEAREFRDYDGPILSGETEFDLRRMFTAESLRGLASVVVAILVLRAPSQSPRAFAVLIGVILIAWAIGGVGEIANPTTRTAFGVVRVLFLAAAGVSFVLVEGFTGERLGQILGAVLVVGGILGAVRSLRSSERGSRFEPLLGAVVYVALGGALLVAPLAMLGLAVLLVSLYWFVTGLVTIVTNVRFDDRQIAPSHTWQMLLEWVQHRPDTADDRRQLYEKIFFEGEEQGRRLSRFFILMGFATGIASWGIIGDSTAVVIGAMLVAPLMTPLMGTALAMSMGWPKRVLMSGAVALAGIGVAVALGVLFGWIYGPDISVVANSQVASRIAPTLVDLMIAVAAGGAGAFALSRPDVSDSLPGVAVAIALVPPLAVVGLMISQDNWAAASGAALLFLTNLVAILLVGGLVFVLTGVVPILQMARTASWRFRSLGMVAILAIAVVAVLGVSAETFRRQTAGLQKASAVVESWLSGSDLEVASAQYEDGTYQIVLSGSSEPPSVDELAATLQNELGQPIPLEVTWVPTSTYTFDP